MGELRCVDGSVLCVTAVTCRDRAGQPFEITLSLARDSVPFASVGQRCGHQLALLADRVTGARMDPVQAVSWPDPDDRFPAPSAGHEAARGHDAAPGGARQPGGFRPGEEEYFSLRCRDRADPPGSGELRCLLRSSAVWAGDCAGTGPRGHGAGQMPGYLGGLPGQRGQAWPAARGSAAGQGQWRLSRRAVIEAWGASGIGVRAVLTSAELVAFLDTVLTEPEFGTAAGTEPVVSQPAGKPGGTVPYWRQRGRKPDATARNRLPALRAQARGGAIAPGDPQARRGDVRR